MHELPVEKVDLMMAVIKAADHMFDDRVSDGEFISMVSPTHKQWDNLGKAMIAYKLYCKREELGFASGA